MEQYKVRNNGAMEERNKDRYVQKNAGKDKCWPLLGWINKRKKLQRNEWMSVKMDQWKNRVEVE